MDTANHSDFIYTQMNGLRADRANGQFLPPWSGFLQEERPKLLRGFINVFVLVLYV